VKKQEIHSNIHKTITFLISLNKILFLKNLAKADNSSTTWKTSVLARNLDLHKSPITTKTFVKRKGSQPIPVKMEYKQASSTMKRCSQKPVQRIDILSTRVLRPMLAKLVMPIILWLTLAILYRIFRSEM